MFARSELARESNRFGGPVVDGPILKYSSRKKSSVLLGFWYDVASNAGFVGTVAGGTDRGFGIGHDFDNEVAVIEADERTLVGLNDCG